MILPFTVANNVLARMTSGCDTDDTTIAFDAASAPFANFPEAFASAPGYVTLTDSLTNPTKVEIISYYGPTTGNDLSNVTRGAQGTTPQNWSAGAIGFMAWTTGHFSANTLLVTNDFVSLGGDTENPSWRIGGSVATMMSPDNDYLYDSGGQVHELFKIDVWPGVVEEGYHRNYSIRFMLQDPSGSGNWIEDSAGLGLLPDGRVWVSRLECEGVADMQLGFGQSIGSGVDLNGTENINWSYGYAQQAYLNGNTTITFTADDDGPDVQHLTLFVLTNDTDYASYGITWPANVKWPGDVVPNVSTGPEHTLIFRFIYRKDLNIYYGSMEQYS